MHDRSDTTAHAASGRRTREPPDRSPGSLTTPPPTATLDCMAGTSVDPGPVDDPRPDDVGTAAGRASPASTGESLRYLVGRVARDPERFVTTIHPLDELFLVGRNHLGDDEIATLAYFRQAAWIADSLGQVARWRFGGLAHVPRLLEFGCGYGRQTRFLVEETPAERVWCTDVDPRATEFVRGTFGVDAFESSYFPGGIRHRERFELITAVLVFSRLPRHTFVATLESLLGLLAPGGLLVFSVNDGRWCPPGKLAEDGFAFSPLADSTADYGTSFVTEAFVRGCLDDAGGPGHPHLRLPRGLSSHEDLYLVGLDPSVTFAGLRFRRGPEGYLGTCETGPAGRVVLGGWIGDPDQADGGAGVVVRLDGRETGVCTTGLPRPDVASLLGEPRLAASGWTCDLGPASGLRGQHDAMLEVVAVARDDRRRLLHAGRLGAVLNAKLA
ncbi:MAG: methyltransferase domain-containing protein [Planctomycetia bacterium]|nr:methyltransferase domain-containing protein [Planctomycetia bacterium]